MVIIISLIREQLQILLRILSEYERISKLLFPPKSSENHVFWWFQGEQKLILGEFKLILNELVNFYSLWMTVLKHQFRIKRLRKLLKSCLFRARQYFVSRAHIYNACIQKVRSSHRRYSLKKVALRNFTVFTGKNMCWSFFSYVSWQNLYVPTV